MILRAVVAASVFAAASVAGFRVSAAGVAGGLDGIDSIYTGYLTRVLERWRSRVAEAAPDDAGPVSITCIRTAGSERYVGMVQRQTIHAALGDVETVLDDIDHYKDLFPGTIDVHVVPGSERQGAGPPAPMRFDTAWLQRPPIFLMPDIRYEMSNRVEKTPARAVYRYELRTGDKLTASDGFVIVEAIDGVTTAFTEYDFFDGHWGPIPTWLVWRESLKAAFQSDVAIRLKAEHPSLSYAKIASEAERLATWETERFERCFAERRPVLP